MGTVTRVVSLTQWSKWPSCMLRARGTQIVQRRGVKTAGETRAEHSHIPYWNEGVGYFSDNTKACFGVVSATQPAVLRALDNLPLHEGAPLSICDYGTADGGSSFSLIGTVVDEIKKKHGQEKEITLYYEDQPSNDFKSVINRVNGLIPGHPSYVMNNSGIYTACVGTSFYSRCFPANSIHLGISFTAMHWLSKGPGNLSAAIHPAASSKKEENEYFKKQAAEDWETILLARAHELVAGGQLAIGCLALDEEGQFHGKSHRVKNSLYEQLSKHWADMVTDKRITQEEFVNTNVNSYFRTIEEFSAPFKDPQSKVRQAGLELVSIETGVLPCPYHDSWKASDKKADPEAAKVHAKRYLPASRTWSNTTFLSGLNSSRTEEEKAQLVDELFERYEADVASSPGDHAADYISAYIHIQKSN